MMKINLSEIWNQENKSEEATLQLPIETVSDGFSDYPVAKAGPLSLKLSYYDKGCMILNADMSVELKGQCDRCLEEIAVPISFCYEQKLYSPERLESEPEFAEDQIYVEEFELDVMAFAKEQLRLNFPDKLLCMEECKGICMKCGQNLNHGLCGCDTFVPDPRWAGLADFFKEN